MNKMLNLFFSKQCTFLFLKSKCELLFYFNNVSVKEETGYSTSKTARRDLILCIDN